MTLPAKPARFHPEDAPPGFEKNVVSFWASRPAMTPRLQLVHTNWADNEGDVDSAKRWAEAAPGSNTCPHFQIDRDGRAALLLPLDRKGIGNYKAAEFSIVIETADAGKIADPPPTGSEFTVPQLEKVAVALAWAAWGYGIPLDYPAEWDGTGSACHTEPYGYPYWTNTATKKCPGDVKKQQMREYVLPLARQILTAWTAPPPPPPDDPGDDMPLSDADIDRIAAAVWRKAFSTPTGAKPVGWIVGQTYVATLRAVRAAEEAAANTRPDDES